MSRVYVDNAKNRKLGRVGMPIGSMPDSKDATGGSDRSGPTAGSEHAAGRGYVAERESSSGTERKSKPGTYVDNPADHRGKGPIVVPELKGSEQATERNSSHHAYVRTTYEVSGKENSATGSSAHQAVPANKVCGYRKSESNGDVDLCHNPDIGKSLDKNVRPKVYADNPQNRKLGRVGMPHGEAVVYKNSQCSPVVATQINVYKDSPQNRLLDRVGLPIGKKVFSSKSQRIVQQNYDDTSINRKLGRVGKPRGCLPLRKSKTTKKIPEILRKIENGDEFEDYGFKDRGAGCEDLEYGLPDSKDDTVKAYDQAMYIHNRRQEELSWERNNASKAPPKTQMAILKDYKGKKIPFTDLKLRKVIGRGGFGQVYFAKWNDTVVAVKKLQDSKISDSRVRGFAEEIMKFCTLDHPNIVKFIGACVQKPNLCIVMEYMQMTLYVAVHINETKFSEQEQIDVIRQTGAGIDYLHKKRIVHCDLKTPNILLDYVQNEILEVKITDFGLSMIIHDSSVSVEELVKNIGTPQYSPPEMLRGEVLSAKDMMKSDVYSLALVFLEVIFNEEPYPDYSYQQLKQEVGLKRAVPEVPSDPPINESIKDIMQKAWNYEPQKRPTAAQIYKVVETCTAIYND